MLLASPYLRTIGIFLAGHLGCVNGLADSFGLRAATVGPVVLITILDLPFAVMVNDIVDVACHFLPPCGRLCWLQYGTKHNPKSSPRSGENASGAAGIVGSWA